MQQHPIPQNVTQYQFRLVGDMTLKQFLELAFGLVLAYFFYASNLIFFIKWPFAILSLFLGFGLAFFPIEERPLDVWITNFLKSIYAPTRYIWRKSFHIPSFFLFQTTPRENTVTATKTVKAPTQRVSQSTPLDLSSSELDRVSSLNALFAAATPAPINSRAPIISSTPRPSVKVRKLSPASIIFDATGSPTAHPLVTPPPSPTLVERTPSPSPSTAATPTTPPPLAPTVSHKATPAPVAAKTINLPAPPKVPNLVVGMILDSSGKMVEGAIVQVVSSSGVPVRAIRTNSLGQFYTATPLENGSYTIEVEKDALTFTPALLQVTGVPIPPLLIQPHTSS